MFVNGVWVGIHRNPDELVKTLRSLRRQLIISAETSIVFDARDGELRLHTEPGRTCRPLFVVENQGLLIKREHARRLIDQVCTALRSLRGGSLRSGCCFCVDICGCVADCPHTNRSHAS